MNKFSRLKRLKTVKT